MTAIESEKRLLRSALAAIAALTIATTAPPARAEAASNAAVTINTAFPGGNATVTAKTDSSVNLQPDLRGGRPWFYWYFEATSTKPGKVTFVFPETVAGFKNGAIGFQGPAISSDQGRTWNWMGTDHVDGSSFSYEFAKANHPVRFAVTIPYLQSELDAFLKKNDSNAHLKTSVLATSRKGRRVELLQIGSPGPDKKAVLVTARHHAAETIASYVLEGFLQEAMSDSESAKEFRQKYVLYAVPFVDKDGVEEGDQGKNRRPHDHNRDYGDESIYPEIQAIKRLDKEKNFRFALDFHCPTLVMNDHQVMYFVGPKEHPQYNFQNVSEFAGWIKKGLPKNSATVGPYVWLRPAKTPTPMNSHYFGFKPGTIMAATLEIPFAPRGKSTDAASCREYGQSMLAAWVATHFRSPEFYKTFEKWAEEDTGKVVAPDEILVIGSSSIRGWSSMATDLHPAKVIPRGFGGSRMKDVLQYKEFFRRYRAQRIVIYEGDNDLGGSSDLDPQVFLQQCREFVDYVRVVSPKTRFYFISIKPSTARMKKWPRMKQGNDLLREYAAADEQLEYIDVASRMLKTDGTIREELIGKDGVHMTRAGYDVWTEVIRAVVK